MFCLVYSIEQKVRLHNGVEKPQLGIGVFKVEEGDTVFHTVQTALELGYRAIDTAAIYRNEEGVGRAIKESVVSRDSLFITTKVWNEDQGYDSTLKAFETSLKKLELDVLIGSMPMKGEEKDAVKKNVLEILKNRYNIEEEDFLSAEIEVVPAGKARDFGLDRSMIMGYGQDDKVCAYTSLRAFLETKPCKRTISCILVDKEEIGSVGSTGMESSFFENAITEMCQLLGHKEITATSRCLSHSHMLSSDVNAAYDPLYSDVMDDRNASFFNYGVVFCKYTGSRGKSGSNDASAEFIAKIRNIMDTHSVRFQISELGKVDAGGGGTIAYILANRNVNVIDCGVGVLSMHAPWEITSKSDIYEAYKCYVAFLENA